MINAFLHFMRSLLKMPRYAQLWLVLLVIVNGIVPLFFLGRMEAQATLGIFLAGALLMIALTALSGFSRLLGAGHFLWFVLWACSRPASTSSPPTTSSASGSAP